MLEYRVRISCVRIQQDCQQILAQTLSFPATPFRIAAMVRLPAPDSASEHSIVDAACRDLARIHVVEFDETAVTTAIDRAKDCFGGGHLPAWQATQILDHAATEKRMFGDSSESSEKKRLRIAINQAFFKRQSQLAHGNYILAKQCDDEIGQMHILYKQDPNHRGLPKVTAENVEAAVRSLTDRQM